MKTDESKEARFRRIAKIRVQRVLDQMELLRKCARKARYAYDQHQIDQMEVTLESAVRQTIAAFEKPAKEPAFDWKDEESEE